MSSSRERFVAWSMGRSFPKILDDARDPEISEELLDFFIESGDQLVMLAVAQNPSLTVTRIQQLGAKDDPYVNEQLALHPNCPAEYGLYLRVSSIARQ